MDAIVTHIIATQPSIVTQSLSVTALIPFHHTVISAMSCEYIIHLLGKAAPPVSAMSRRLGVPRG